MFVGMDVHRNRTQVCVLDKKGNEVRNRNVVNDRQSLRKELAGLRKALRSPSKPPTARGGSLPPIPETPHSRSLKFPS